jgi:triacylglycerol lipase
VNYFQGVAERFRGQGHRIFVPQLDPTQGVPVRGNQLRDQIGSAYASKTLDPNEKTHVIAHSLGGLDSRYILSPANPNRLAVPVRSLTTIGTPHFGSPVADLLEKPADFSLFPHLPFGLGNPLEDALGILHISLNGLRDVTTASCQKFSSTSRDNPDVVYFSIAGSGRTNFPETSAAFLLFYKYISALTGQPNDGMVPVASAKWGSFDAHTWSTDHGEEIGHNLDNPLGSPVFNYLGGYDQILARIANI